MTDPPSAVLHPLLLLFVIGPRVLRPTKKRRSAAFVNLAKMQKSILTHIFCLHTAILAHLFQFGKRKFGYFTEFFHYAFTFDLFLSQNQKMSAELRRGSIALYFCAAEKVTIILQGAIPDSELPCPARPRRSVRSALHAAVIQNGSCRFV